MKVGIAIRVRQLKERMAGTGRLPGKMPASSANLRSMSETSRMPTEENHGAKANKDGCSCMDLSCTSSSER